MPAGNTSLYVTGGREKSRKFDEWNAYDRAMILRIDAGSGDITTVAEYVSPPEACPEVEPSITFKSATIQANRLYIPTNTEALVYDVPSFRLVDYWSLPWFNDLHYITPAADANLLVVSTGLDMVAEMTHEGRILREWPAVDFEIWGKFSREVDYRRVATTKPHLSHPNFVIQTGDDIWVTRLAQNDVYCLTQPGRRVEFCGRPHDGVRSGGKVYFTTVNGYIHVLDEATMSLEDTINLNGIGHTDVALGWMRGVLPVEDGLCWVGFTRLRPTKIHENLSWIRHGFRQFYLPTRIALYDLARKILVREIDIEPHGINAVFSILPEPAGD